jgi:hypothetical protein
MNFKKGDHVRIRAEWLNPGEPALTMVCAEDEIRGRIGITPKESSLAIPPVERVDASMLERIP